MIPDLNLQGVEIEELNIKGWNAKGIMRFNWYMSEVAKGRGRKGGYEEEQESEMKGLYRDGMAPKRHILI